jgi:hypothetical protein
VKREAGLVTSENSLIINVDLMNWWTWWHTSFLVMGNGDYGSIQQAAN